MKITFLEPPPLNPRKKPERLFGCSYELYHFLDFANLHIFALLDRAGFTLGYWDAILDKLAWPKFLRLLQKDEAKIYILHSVFLSKKVDLFTIKKLRRIKPHALILVHGPEPTRDPAPYLLDENVLVFRGEPEENILRFLQKNNPQGISFRKNGKLTTLPYTGHPLDVNQFPILNRLHPAIKRYTHSYRNPKLSKTPQTVMLTSRGCAFRCRFCVPNSVSFAREIEHLKFNLGKPKPSIFSTPRVMAEFRQIKKQGFGAVMIIDDQFLWDQKRTLEICRGIKDLEIEWGCLSRADFLTDPQIVQALASAGCRLIDIGVESLEQKVLDYIRKDLQVAAITKALENLERFGIEAKLNIILGACPWETPTQIKASVRKLKKMHVYQVMFSLATPFPGTAYYQTCVHQGYLKGDLNTLDPTHRALVSYPKLSAEQLEDLQKWANRSFYLRPKIIFHRLKSYKNLHNLAQDLRILAKLLASSS